MVTKLSMSIKLGNSTSKSSRHLDARQMLAYVSFVRTARDAGSLPRLRNPSGSTDQTKVIHNAKTISVPISSMLRPPASTWRKRDRIVVRPPLHAGPYPCAMTTASPVNCEKWENSPQPKRRAAIRVTHLAAGESLLNTYDVQS